MSHPSEKLFEAMRHIVEAPGFELLKNFSRDFYVLDKEALQTLWADDMKYLWVIRESGTNLWPLHIDAGLVAEEIQAIFETFEQSKMQVYLLSDQTAKLISIAKAKELASVYNYKVTNGTIEKTRKGLFGKPSPVAQYRVELQFVNERRIAHLYFNGARSVEQIARGDLVAMMTIAKTLVVKESKSLFTPIVEITYNGDSLRRILEEPVEGCFA